jgi:sugar phosphate isomerase/epimerase
MNALIDRDSFFREYDSGYNWNQLHRYELVEDKPMSTALIGWTGFVGSELLLHMDKVDLYNSSNIHTIRGREYNRVYFSGLPAEKWKANKHPEDDKKTLDSILSLLKTVDIKQFVLISTVDVLDTSGKDYAVHPYGVHRRQMEEWVETHVSDHYILRLPALFGKGLKKNILYDLIFNNNIELISSGSEFQWYNISHIHDDIELIIRSGRRLTHLTSTPICNREIIETFFPEHIRSCNGTSIVRYSCPVDPLIPRRNILQEIGEYVSYERAIRNLPVTLSISNIAWDHNHTGDIAKLLRKYRIQFVELAPTTIAPWGEPIEYPLSVSGLQSILYNTGIRIFETPDEFVSHCRRVARLCNELNGKTLVFGSPNQRHVREGVDIVTYFRQIADISSEESLQFCVEPNSKQYGCTWLTNLSDTVEFVRSVDRPNNIQLNVDTGNYIMENDSFVFDSSSVTLIGNVQVSNEMLLPYSDTSLENRERLKTLVGSIIRLGYNRTISLEMRKADISTVARSIDTFVRDVISCTNL